MASPSILLVGIGGVYNYGCEAIVRGTENILRSAWPRIEILYGSRRHADDRARLADTDVQVLDRTLRRFSSTEITRKVLRRLGIAWHPAWDSREILDGVDAVFSIGGDIYTLSPQGDYPAGLIKFSEMVTRAQIPYILWSASVGPFTEKPAVERIVAASLARASLISAREKGTSLYLRQLGLEDNVTSCADPAFTVASEINAAGKPLSEKPRIAINLSPLSLRFTGISTEEMITRQVKGIESVVEELEASVLLVPHVISPFYRADDDLTYLKEIKKRISPDLQGSVEVLEGDLGFIATKQRLADCDLVIAARMHCAISALSARVPTLLVAYSQKAFGMGEFVYGDREQVVEIKEFTPEMMLVKTKELLSRRGELIHRLQARIPEIIEEAYHPISALRKILPG